jgi:hypothetical protein
MLQSIGLAVGGQCASWMGAAGSCLSIARTSEKMLLKCHDLDIQRHRETIQTALETADLCRALALGWIDPDKSWLGS